MGQQSDGFPAGSLVVSGREQTVDSTGRADLVPKHGGDFQLVQHHGANSGVGMHKVGRTLRFRGALPTGFRIEKRPSGSQHYCLWAVLKEGGHSG